VVARRALSLDAGGYAVLQCIVVREGWLGSCTVSAEPAGVGFEQAALALSPYFKLQARTDAGVSTEGIKMSVPLRFAPR
jgi:hypothetical protein